MARRTRGRVFVWSTRRFQLVADRLGVMVAYGPFMIGYRKGFSGWRWIGR